MDSKTVANLRRVVGCILGRNLQDGGYACSVLIHRKTYLFSNMLVDEDYSNVIAQTESFECLLYLTHCRVFIHN